MILSLRCFFVSRQVRRTFVLGRVPVVFHIPSLFIYLMSICHNKKINIIFLALSDLQQIPVHKISLRMSGTRRCSKSSLPHESMMNWCVMPCEDPSKTMVSQLSGNFVLSIHLFGAAVRQLWRFHGFPNNIWFATQICHTPTCWGWSSFVSLYLLLVVVFKNYIFQILSLWYPHFDLKPFLRAWLFWAEWNPDNPPRSNL